MKWSCNISLSLKCVLNPLADFQSFISGEDEEFSAVTVMQKERFPALLQHGCTLTPTKSFFFLTPVYCQIKKMRTQKVIPVKIPQMNCSQAGRNCFWQPERKMMLPANKWTGAWLIDCLIRRKLIASQCNNWRIVWVIFHVKIKNAWKKNTTVFLSFIWKAWLPWPGLPPLHPEFLQRVNSNLDLSFHSSLMCCAG